MVTCHLSYHPHSYFVTVVVTALVFLPLASHAAQWASPANGAFQDAGRWSPAGVPGSSDNAEFPPAGTYTVGFSADAATDRLVVTGGNVTLDLNSRTYMALKSTGVSYLPASLHINGPNQPSLTVTDGLLEIQSAVLGEGSGNTGELVLDGAGAHLDAAEILFLGQGGEGSVLIRNGATGVAKAAYVGITNDANNTISVNGGQSRFTITDRLDIGDNGGRGSAGAALNGELIVGELILAAGAGSVGQIVGFDGGHVHIQGEALLGSASGNQGGKATLTAQEFGRITIGGALKYDHNSRLEINGSLDVGSMERTSDLPHTGSFVTWYLGSLRVRSDVTTFDLGFSNLSHESQLHVDGDLHLDSRRPFMIDDKHGLVTAGSLSGMGQFEFTAGELTLGTLTLGTAPGMRPSLTVDGQFVSETQFSVVGATDIQQEGHLALSKTTTTFDGIVINSGSLYVSESQVTFNGTGALGFEGLVSTGSLSIRDSTVAGTVMPGPGSSFQVDGEVTFNGPVKTRVDITRPAGSDRPKINLNSELHMGTVASQTAAIVIEADVALGPDSKLLFGIGGTGSGKYDSLEVEGIVTLGGTLEVSLLSGFTPSPGDRISFITADRLVGTFSEFDLPALPGGMTLDMERLQLGELLVLSGLPGDYNNDGMVDAADYVVWRNALGTPVTLTNDPTLGVNADDYEQWKANYGRSVVTALVAARQVPEPRGIALALLLLGGVAGKRPGYRG